MSFAETTYRTDFLSCHDLHIINVSSDYHDHHFWNIQENIFKIKLFFANFKFWKVPCVLLILVDYNSLLFNECIEKFSTMHQLLKLLFRSHKERCFSLIRNKTVSDLPRISDTLVEECHIHK